ncbi:hypothetical protein SLINC_0673 [Streptomyces lincolnensis]|uniref:Uncharacterized protein n=1 Tax=Streptomyces lincolnensis TaxID=1915 RepID=A0A1B1M388_STRLN|nr:hypothetical protein [Streptomyces lincolnensis]ANS62897.1 hypothetical protein SLINC_0673 [Streptomyces lincolnensis]AXG51821.1 hypothetical protein SLCG_0666 [Streptomyces lincolnensis]QMV04827.1 hypothetical protein GJU35_03570 [Streptomyces lincolnensis]
MEILLLRVCLAPCLVLLVSVVARRLGPRRGGQLIGAPTSTGPFLLLMCSTYGPGPAARAAHGCVTGTLVVVCFGLAYARLAPVLRPAWTLLAALAGAATAGLAGALCGSVLLTAGLTVAVIFAGLATRPSGDRGPRPTNRARAWEIPMRMAVSALMVLGAVATARALGSFLGGVLAALPILLAVMGTALHRSAGASVAADLMRGALHSTAGTLCFLLVLGTALVPLGPAPAFLLALAALTTAHPLVRLSLPALYGRPAPGR